MKTFDKIIEKGNNRGETSPVTIAFLGDSVTQGCFENYEQLNKRIETVFDSKNSYSDKLKRILYMFCPATQINIINSGISGDNAKHGNERFERDIARYCPDLVVVGYSLNDCCFGEEGKKIYREALKEIFRKVKKLGAECIFLTPNLMNDKISPHLPTEQLRNLAEEFSQKGDILDEYVSIGKQVAEENGVAVCDVYAKWKTLKEKGVDTTELLSNKLNHPTRDMHWLPAFMLAEIIIGG